ncbi:LANO_0D01200g1_1 [Lachancea nothofagi CBS 11611]|uniref:LANO_0D01200g1_1 n=1 Tax=Lachancea nothofagi CBS 11611 TaxID=1266666 RepID=A0A1G4JD80_9SACH|nr:LANO_0D01200g1_1 [Lachancea nothofagi CBS 11611]
MQRTMLFSRFLRVLSLFSVLLVSLHFSALYLSADDASLCSTPILGQTPWFKQKACPWWDAHVEPHRKELARPLALQWQKQEQLARSQVESTSHKATAFAKEQVLPCACKWYHIVRIKTQMYHNVYVVPHIKHASYKVQLWLQSDSQAAKLTLRASNEYFKLLKILESWTCQLNIWARPKLVESAQCIKPLFAQLKHRAVEFRHSFENYTETEIQESDAVTDVEEELQYYDAEDDFEDESEEETIYLTSTIIETVTLSDNQLAAPTSIQEASMDLEVPLRDLVQDEFQAWSNTVEQKALNTEHQFDLEIENLVQSKLDEIRPRITVMLQDISNSTQQHYKTINRAILDVNCTMELHPETGEQLYFNQEGSQLRKYVTRPLVREYFSQAHTHVDETLEQINEVLEAFVAEINTEVDQVRQEHLEVYEEWGDVMISEWSKRMAYVDVMAAMESDDLSQAQHDNWKQFLKLKKQVVATRDMLMKHAANLQDVEKFLREIQLTSKALQREAGEYLFILRSKANLAFQGREELERRQHQEQMEREKKEQEERERQEREDLEKEELARQELENSLYSEEEDDAEEFYDSEYAINPDVESKLLHQEQLQREMLDLRENELRQQLLHEQREDELNHSSQSK